jgi:hypothetical protein
MAGHKDRVRRAEIKMQLRMDSTCAKLKPSGRKYLTWSQNPILTNGAPFDLSERNEMNVESARFNALHLPFTLPFGLGRANEVRCIRAYCCVVKCAG